MPSYKYTNGIKAESPEIAESIGAFGHKLMWFLEKGYKPHYWQTLFHSNSIEGKICRFRNIVAGRRGGKTMSAAWEVVYYVLNPQQFHWDTQRIHKSRPLHVWILTQNHIIGRQPLLDFREILDQAGLVYGQDYKENKANKYFEFTNGSLVEFKTADEPERLRGAGLNILWIDEAAVIPDSRAYEVVRPALSDQMGIVICTTTPLGKNWYYDQFWSPEALEDKEVGRVEYRSIDNPHFPETEWKYLKNTYHPLLFKQEYMASFDSMAGNELHGDWLHYYDLSELPKRKDSSGLESLNLKFFVGIDPAISLSDKADRFASVVIGVTPEGDKAYLIEIYVDRIPFPEQVTHIQHIYNKYHPERIGIEDVAFQRSLIQQAARIPGMPPIIPIKATGHKWQRILSMAPLFRLGRICVRKEQIEFINEWVDYDSTLTNQKDDILDAVEIAIRTAGVLLPRNITEDDLGTMLNEQPAYTIEQLAAKDIPKDFSKKYFGWDEHLGADW